MTELLKIYRNNSGTIKAMVNNAVGDFIIQPRRCFPITDADHYIALLTADKDGATQQEVLLIDDLQQLDKESKQVMEEELNNRCMSLEIKKIYSIRQSIGKLIFYVITGENELKIELESPKDIYALQPCFVLVRDIKGNSFIINMSKIDARSRSLLEAYI